MMVNWEAEINPFLLELFLVMSFITATEKQTRMELGVRFLGYCCGLEHVVWEDCGGVWNLGLEISLVTQA